MSLKKPTVFLWGMMGAGKSSISKQIAARTGLKRLDLDELIVESTGESVEQIFNRIGERGFRKIEAETLKTIGDGQVVACGGGTPIDAINREWMLKNGLCIYLKAEPGLLAHRVWNARTVRPLVADQASETHVKEKLSSILKDREAFYCEAHHIVEVGKVAKSTLVDQIVSLIYSK